jgi:peptidoglycan hydrolase-like protein with peptidoglycan-binding domain
MTTLNESKFLNKQKDVCEDTVAERPPPKICPTCIPNPDAIVPTWYEAEEPFLDEQRCEYVVRVNVNDNGDSYDVSQMRESGKSLREVLNSYKIAGIYQLLRFFEKEISNQVIFAFADDPQKLKRLLRRNRANTEQLIEKVTQSVTDGVFDIYSLSEGLIEAYGLNAEGFNPEALELYARADDYWVSLYQTPKGGEPIWVKVVIPAFIFNRIPEGLAGDEEESDTSGEREVIIDGTKFKGKIRRLKHVLGVYSKYQAYWWQSEKGKLAFQNDPIKGSYKNSFYCKIYIDKINDIADEIESLIESQTDFKLRNRRTNRAVDKIKITFKQRGNNPYYIKKLEVMGFSCPEYERINLNSLKANKRKYKAPFNNETALGYIANLNPIDSDLNARETPPWLDFLVKYTYPKLTLDYGNASPETSVTDGTTSILGCIVDNNGGTEGLRDFFFDQVISTFEAIEYKWNQNACKVLAGAANAARAAGDAARSGLSDEQAEFQQDQILGELQEDLDKTSSGGAFMFAEAAIERGIDDLEEELYKFEKEIELQEKIDFWVTQRDKADEELNEIVGFWTFFFEQNNWRPTDFIIGLAEQQAAEQAAIDADIAEQEAQAAAVEAERLQDQYEVDAFAADVFGGPIPTKPDSEIVDLSFEAMNLPEDLGSSSLLDEGTGALSELNIPESVTNAVENFLSGDLEQKIQYALTIVSQGNSIAATAFPDTGKADSLQRNKTFSIENIDKLNKELQELQESTARSRAREERKAENEQRRNNKDEARFKRKETKQVNKEADGILSGRKARKQNREQRRKDNKFYRADARAARTERRQSRGAERGENPFIAYGREAALKGFDFENSLISLFLNEEEFSNYGLSGFNLSRIGGKRKKGEGAKQRLKNFFDNFGICGFNKLLEKAIKCLLSGMDLRTALNQIVRAAISNMSPAAMEKLLVGLDPRKQAEIREYVAQQFQDMPAPWERDYQPGRVTTDQQMDAKQLSSVSDNISSNAGNIEKYKTQVSALDDFVSALREFLGEIEQQASSTQLPTGITLRVGDAGNNVKILQQLLIAEFGPPIPNEPGLDPRFSVDGSFGPVTELAVEYYQTTKGLTVDGIVGPQTINSLNGPRKPATLSPENIDQISIQFSANDDIKQFLVSSLTGKTPEQAPTVANQIKDDLNKKIEELETKGKELQGSLTSEQLQQWQNMTDEERQQMINDARIEAGIVVDVSNPEQVRQGSIGKALGNVQGAIFDAYVEAFMSLVGIEDLFAALDKIPGAKLIGRIIASFDCPNVHFIYPPVRSFLSTLTFKQCLDGGRLAFPKLPRLPNIRSLAGIIFRKLVDILVDAVADLITRVITALLLKVLLTIENALCKALEAVGRFAAEAVKGPDANFGGMMRDLFCDDGTSDSDVDDLTSSLLTDAGITNTDLQNLAKNATASDLKNKHKEITETIARISSRRELEQLLVANDGEQDINTLKRISSTISLKFPEFAIFFDDPSKVAAIFSNIGNRLSPEQRANVRDGLTRPGVNVPVDASVCLTSDQMDEWNDKRKTILTNAGMNPVEAEDYVAKLNDRAAGDLLDLADALAKGPEQVLGDAIDNAFGPGFGGQNPNDKGRLNDPFCPPTNASSIVALDTEESLQEAAELAEGTFRSLSFAFSNDMIGKRDSFLDNILADTCNLPLKRHEQRANNFVFQIDWANSQEDWDAKKERFSTTKLGEIYFEALSSEEPIGVFPETVGILTKEKLDANDFAINFKTTEKVRPQTKTKTIEKVGSLKNVNVKIRRTYRKEPDLVLDFFNDKNEGCRFEYELMFTNYEDGEIKIKKELGYRTFIYYYGNEYEKSFFGKEDEDKEIPYDRLEYKVVNTVGISGTGSALVEQHGSISEKNLQELKVPYQGVLFSNYISSILSASGHSALPVKQIAKDSYKNYMEYLYKGVLKGLNQKLDGTQPEGYDFGYVANDLTPDDVLYVNPEATSDESTWEYTYDEEEMVLGKSATNNERVHFLDPAIYGGSYNNPPFYIEPQKFKGWLGIASALVPEFDGCKPRRTDFIGLKELADNVTKLEQAIPPDSRLSEDPDCINHTPFDKISDPSTLAYLDTTIAATIRIYAAEAMVKSMPVLSHMRYSEDNYDTGFASVIVEKMEQGLSETDALIPIFGGRVQFYNYWLLFLECAVMALVRKVNMGEIESNSEIDEARSIIDKAQRRHLYPNRDVLRVIKGYGSSIERIKTINPAKIDEDYKNQPRVRQILKGCYIAGYPGLAQKGRLIDQTIDFDPLFLSLNGARFASHINTIYDVRRECKILLKYLVSHEISQMMSNLNERFDGSQYIYDFYRYTLALPDVYAKTGLKSGLTETEAPITDGEISYGSVPDVGDVSSVDLTAAGGFGFYIEKYVRTVEKPEEFYSESPFWANPDSEAAQIVKNMPNSLKGVCNIKEFGEYFSQAKDLFDENANISDIFGDASISEGSDEYLGSTGLKFGVRIIMVPDAILAGKINEGEIDSKFAREEKSYNLQSIPVASFEQDIPDIKFKELKFNNPTLDEDLKCYIDNLVKTDEFVFLMDYVFGIKKLPSILLTYVNEAFIQAVGADVERDVDNIIDRFDDAWKGEILSDSKRECRRLFAAFYRSDDFEVPEGDDGRTLAEVLEQMKKGSLFGRADPSMRWWRRRRQRGRPYNKDGNECAGEFGGLFKN